MLKYFILGLCIGFLVFGGYYLVTSNKKAETTTIWKTLDNLKGKLT